MFFEHIAELSTLNVLFLLFALGVALSFEFVNGFHDTANAVATVIYTKSLKPYPAVILSGLCNFAGVYLGGIAVAYSIVHLLPVELLVTVNTNKGMAMIFSLLVAAIIWNFGTWWLGLPASSSHTLIGSIIGVALANAIAESASLSASVNWSKALEVGMSLLLSPIIGFALAALLLLGMMKFITNKALHQAPKGDTPPPFWIRLILIFTCTGVSFAHGSNDGQKGIGLIMLILIGIMPAAYSLNVEIDTAKIENLHNAAGELQSFMQSHDTFFKKAMEHGKLKMPKKKSKGFPVNCGMDHAIESAEDIQAMLNGVKSISQIPLDDRWRIRTEILCLDDAIGEFLQLDDLSDNDRESLETWQCQLREPIEYAPHWVAMAVAIALGLGTTIGWKRIVVTIGEKIGKTQMTYAQGAAAQTVAMVTIGLADGLGLPVSTTHVLSSGVAGTMTAGKGGLQASTIRSIVLAWVLTLPAAVVIAGVLYFVFTGIAG